MIRSATKNDIPACVEMAREFWQYMPYDEEYEAERTTEMFELALSYNLLLVFDKDGKAEGFIAGVMGPLLASTKAQMAIELAYWINPAHRGVGVQLLRSFEKAAKEQGAKYCSMMAMEGSNPEIAERIYTKLGYAKTETSYTKIIGGE